MDNKRRGMFGKKHSLEAIKKISDAKKGKKRSKESVEKMINTMKYQYNNGLRKKGMLGKKLTDKQKKSMSDMRKEEYKSGKREPIRMYGKNNPFYRKTHSEETIKKIKLANIGKKHSKEHIEKRTRRGSDASNWRGGKSFEPYNKNFSNRFKNVIRKRDNQICMLCNIHREKLKIALNVHHIDYNKLTSIKENCISLCTSCHTKTNFNRKHWRKFLQSLLSEKYGYNYSESNEIIINMDEVIFN